MVQMVDEYKLECYQKIQAMNADENLWLVEENVTKRRFVMRKLPMASQSVYQRLATIHHANIVEIADFFSHDGFLYVIEEYLQWEPLSEVIKEHKLSHRSVLSIGRQLFNALLVLHENNIIHRDIKPENIMMDVRGNVKLIDFHIARLFAEDKNSDTSIKGSRDYAPPEQFGFAQSDQRTDIYALGVTLNELVVGKLPEDKVCSGILGAVVRRCTEFDPKRRYQSAEQALKHITLLKKRNVLLGLLVVVFLLFLLTLVKIFAIPDNSFKGTTLFSDTQYQDRIIYVQNADRYPALLMTENGEYEFSTDLGNNQTVAILAGKENERLTLTYTLADGSNTIFEFDDIFSDISVQQKNSPEYEILLDDLDGDGVTDLLVTLAWRYRVNTPDPIYRYYRTAYNILWVVYMAENGEVACSDPLFFFDYRPSLQTDNLIYNSAETEWYVLKNGTWEAWP